MSLEQALKVLLADQVAMSMKAHGFHWNVEGPMFHQFHAFFGAIYDDVDGSIDPTAENIRKIDGYAPFLLSTIDKLQTLKDKKATTDPMDMCRDLDESNEAVIDSIAKAFEAAIEADEQGIANFLSERDGMHKKWRWQLSATLKK